MNTRWLAVPNVLVPVVALALGACTAGTDTSPAAAELSAQAAPELQAGQTLTPASFERGPLSLRLTDAEIAGVVTAIDVGEVSQGQVADARARDHRVIAFAEQAVQDHTRSASDQATLLRQVGVRSQVPTAVSAFVTLQGNVVLDSLSVTPAFLFDKAYLTSQIFLHSQVLLLLDLRLIPDAEDPTFRAFLFDVRNTVQQHLDRASELRSQL